MRRRTGPLWIFHHEQVAEIGQDGALPVRQALGQLFKVGQRTVRGSQGRAAIECHELMLAACGDPGGGRRTVLGG